MAIPDEQWPAIECAPNDPHILSLAQLRELTEVDEETSNYMDRMREKRIAWFHHERDKVSEELSELALSDVITFHSYDPAPKLEERIKQLQTYNRAMICTEYMARGNGSFFFGGLMVGSVHHVGMINWGLVQGKTQTNLPWDSWQHPYVDREPSIWFHEVFRTDGRPYIPEEVAFIKRMTGKAKSRAAAK